MKKHIIIQVIVVVAIIALAVVMVIDLFPMVQKVIQNAGNEADMVNYIESFGARGVTVLMGLQTILVIFPFFPSAAVQVLTGLCFGAYWGTLIILGGMVLGNTIVFVVIRQMKGLFVPLFHKEEDSSDSDDSESPNKKGKRKKLISKEQLEKMKRPELVAFFFFLIPGVPNGIVPYVFARTKISFWKYITVVILGNIPSAFVCTFLGERVSAGSFTTAIVIACVVVAIVLVAVIFRKKLMAFITHERENAKATV